MESAGCDRKMGTSVESQQHTDVSEGHAFLVSFLLFAQINLSRNSCLTSVTMLLTYYHKSG